MKHIMKYTSKNILMFILTITIFSCSLSTEKDIAQNLVAKYVKENKPNYESFEIIELSEIDSVFTLLTEQESLKNFAKEFYDNKDKINNISNEIDNTISYLEELEPYYKEARSEVAYAVMSLNQFLGYDQYGNQRIGPTIQSHRNYSIAKRNLNNVSNKMNEARKEVASMKMQLDVLQHINDTIYQCAIDFCNKFKPIYLGKGAIFKCEYKDKNGYLQSNRLKVLFDNELTKIIKVEKKIVNDEEVKQFISECKLDV